MAVNFPVADGGRFVVFAADYLGESSAGQDPDGDGHVLGWLDRDGLDHRARDPATLAVAYNGKVRDRVGQGDTALAPDGALDGR